MSAATATTEQRSGRDVARIVAEHSAAPVGWDDRVVHVPGGHVMQSAAWAAYRRSAGDRPCFVEFADGAGALALLRRSVGLPGVEAVIRRGPAHRREPVGAYAARCRGLAAWARARGARDLFLDPERPADAAYDAAMETAGFHVADELEPSIHVMRLELGEASEEASLWAGLSKSTRQRIRAAEAASTTVSEDVTGTRLADFLPLMRERADALGIPLREGTGFLAGWRALMAAGLARLLVADHDGQLVGGLLIYRQGGIHATAYSADAATLRHALPGTMHLLRWRAIRDAAGEGCEAIELGGVDLPGHREPPGPGEPNHGLYEHKRSFGARWQERSAARRIVLRPELARLATLRREAIDRALRWRRHG
jgi:lipid II:glycine glycyltransferase (peptidoglycan interpeptide bridge formation enzyme)